MSVAETASTEFKKLLQEYTQSVPHEGDVIAGAVLSVSKAEVRVEIDGLMVGVARGRELMGNEADELTVGDVVEATVLEEENENGEIELSFRAAGFVRAWKKMEELLKSQEVTEVKVLDANKGGLMVVAEPLRGFLPVSQLSPDNYPRIPGGDRQKILDHLRGFINTTMRVKIMDAQQRDEKLIVSEKLVWEEEQKDVLDKYSIGDVIEGKISALTSFGAFVEFGENLEGLVHISEIAWQRIDHPKDVLQAGEQVKAQIIQIDGSKIFLSMKRMQKDPWKSVKDRYAIDQKVRGRVIKVNPFGLFVELDKEIHGLAHISELTNDPMEDISTFAKPGDELDFEVVSIEPAAHRLGLRIAGVKPKPVVKKAEKDPEAAKTADPVEEVKEESKEDKGEEPAAEEESAPAA